MFHEIERGEMEGDEEDSDDEGDDDEEGGIDEFGAHEGDLDDDDDDDALREELERELAEELAEDEDEDEDGTLEEEAAEAAAVEASARRDARAPSAPSAFQRAQDKLARQINTLEERALQEKTWLLKGEASAKERPKNSVLEADLEFDHVQAPPPVVSEEMTAKLEDIIKARIAEQRFDDVERVEPGLDDDRRRKTLPELDDTKSKKGLGDIYADEFVKQRAAAEGRASGLEEKEDPLVVEAKSLFKALTTKLDALSHFHFAPKPVMEEMAVKVDAPALEAEEVAPAMASDASRKAPEEIFAGGENQGGVRGSARATSNPRGSCPRRNARRRARNANARRRRWERSANASRRNARERRRRRRRRRRRLGSRERRRRCPCPAAAPAGRKVKVRVRKVVQGVRNAAGGEGGGRRGTRGEDDVQIGRHEEPRGAQALASIVCCGEAKTSFSNQHEPRLDHTRLVRLDHDGAIDASGRRTTRTTNARAHGRVVPRRDARRRRGCPAARVEAVLRGGGGRQQRRRVRVPL